MKKLTTLTIILLSVTSLQLFAQSGTYRKANQVNNELNTTLRNTKSTVDSTTQMIKDSKKLISELIPSKPKSQSKPAVANQAADTHKIIGTTKVSLFITDIEYEDDNLELLCITLKKMSGITGISKNYKNGTAGIVLNTKLNPFEIWDNVPLNLRKLFKMLETSENSLLLKYKSAPQDDKQKTQTTSHK